MAGQEAQFDMNALLEGTLEDLADLPEFKPYPPGSHHISIKLEQKIVNKHPGFDFKMKLIECKELADPQKDVAPEVGAETSILFLLDNEIGQGQFKKVLTAAAAKFGNKKNSELIADMQNAEALVITKLRENKKSEGTFYTDVVEILFI